MNIPRRAGDAAQALRRLKPADPEYAIRFVDALLDAACEMHASDVHVQPTARGVEVRWRLDGVLQPLGEFPRGETADVVARLKVLAELLTYRTDMPQEGRIRDKHASVEIRVSTFPTLYGERAVVRLFASQGRYLHVDDLQLPAEVAQRLKLLLIETAGAILITGPAGSGKTTTAYACLREIVRASGGRKSLVSLEDPIEFAVDGVSQSQVNAAAGFDLDIGLRSLMRQDPEVILVGEIRDRETAATTLQAALTGHLVITTFHAGSSAAALSRLAEMGMEPYQLLSGILAVVSQRLIRRLCDCGVPISSESDKLQLPVTAARTARGCEDCWQTGYQGRMLLAESLSLRDASLTAAILNRHDAVELERVAVRAGLIPLMARAAAAVESGLTSPEEVRRVLGFGI
jgi:type II secretory ATPase GspE/PulE/Tfp pilus assembly ATPase PilB-like protein